jgi:hypothetical protein
MDQDIRYCTFADVPLNRIRRSHVEIWIKRQAAEGKAPGTIKTRYVNIRAVLRAAVRDKLVATGSVRCVVLPPYRAKTRYEW